jgi:hypothetical protein
VRLNLKLIFPVLAVAATAVAVCAVCPAAGAATKDPVVTAIAKAKGISAADRSEFRRIWRSSGSTMAKLKRQHRTRRAQEIASQRGIVTRMAKRGRLSGDRMAGVMASTRVTAYVFDKQSYPRSQERRTPPFDSVVYAYYPGSGMQLQPLFTFTQANLLYAARQTDKLETLVKRMEELAVTRPGGYLGWEYGFPYAGATPPWISGMAQGVALQVLARTYERTKDKHYLALGKRVLAGFRITAARGGVSSYEHGGRWYLLYAFNPNQRVLNGHLQALIGLADYERVTEDETAAIRLDEGIRAVLPLLKRFDTGAWSRYQYGQEANLNYHDVMTHQFDRLADLTDVPEFADYAHRFATYRITPPSVVPLASTFVAIYPKPVDKFRDSVRIPYFLDKQATVKFTFRDRTGKGVRTITQRAGRGKHAVIWNGRNGSGHFVGAGTYTVAVNAKDIIGNVRVSELTAPIEIKRDTTKPEVESASVKARAGGHSTVTLIVVDHESPRTLVKVIGSNGKVLGIAIGKGHITIPVNPPPATVRKGKLKVTDTAGNAIQVPL